MRIFRPRPLAAPMFRIICFPYAGGSAVFFSKWLKQLRADAELVSVEYPGHGSRVRELPCRTIEEIVGEAHDDLAALLDVPVAFFGHSMGALVAFELTRRLLDVGGRAPRHLFLSARGAPHLAPIRQSPRSNLSTEDLIRIMVELGGSAQAVLANKDLVDLFLPALRADLGALENWKYTPGPPLSMPFSLFGGTDDAESPWPRVEAWQALTTGPVSKHVFPGRHFFIQEHYAAVVRIISDRLSVAE